MAELYGQIEQVKAMLRPDETVTFGSDAESRLGALQVMVSLTIEERTGRVFGGTAADETRVIDGPEYASDVLLLPVPVRSVTTVAITGADAETLTAYNYTTNSGDYVLWYADTPNGDYGAIKRFSGTWPCRTGLSRISIAARWADAANGGTVPDDITYAANWLIAEHYKNEQAARSGMTGPDGATIPLRNPWRHPTVLATLRRRTAFVHPLVF